MPVCYRFTCRLIRARSRKGFRAMLYRIAETFIGHAHEGDDSHGIIKHAKDIHLSIVFKTNDNLCHFESELLKQMSAVSGFKRPRVDKGETILPDEIGCDDRLTTIIPTPAGLSRIFHYQYMHDPNSDDADNSAFCDGYSDIGSWLSDRTEFSSINDPETRVQMIEDPCSPYWISMAPEKALIKDKAKCKKPEKDDPNNLIHMSNFLHCCYDGLNAKVPMFPSMKIRFVWRDLNPVACPLIGQDEADRPYGLRQRYRVTVHVISFNTSVHKYVTSFLKPGGITIDHLTYQLDMYFLDGAKAEIYLQWKEAQTENVWKHFRGGVAVAEIAEQMGIGDGPAEEDGGAMETEGNAAAHE